MRERLAFAENFPLFAMQKVVAFYMLTKDDFKHNFWTWQSVKYK